MGNRRRTASFARNSPPGEKICATLSHAEQDARPRAPHRFRGRLPGAVVLGVAALSIALAPIPSGDADPSHHWFRIRAGEFAFDPNVITVRPGDTVTFELVADDVMHGLYIDEYDLEVTADPGKSASLTFVADRPGTVRLRCSVTCGPLHPFMVGKLRVGTNALFWRGAALALLVAVVGIRRARP